MNLKIFMKLTWAAPQKLSLWCGAVPPAALTLALSRQRVRELCMQVAGEVLRMRC